MKASFGFKKLIPSVIAVTTGIASVVILSQALRTLPAGTDYAAWTGIGATGSVLLGIQFFSERDPARWSALVSSSRASSAFG
jgi:quaternary ammonium compound-resistance protein SugE